MAEMQTTAESDFVIATYNAAKAIDGLVQPTPLQEAATLSDELGTNVLFKREDLTDVHSFKIRGAAHTILGLSQRELEHGVLAASAGNHAQGVALSAAFRDVPATIVMPKTTPQTKIRAVRSYGANVVLEGDSYSDAYEASQELLGETGATFIHPFDDSRVILGQATVGKEIAEQTIKTDVVFVPVGGGGLIAGVARFLKAVEPRTTIIGVQPEDSNAMQLSLEAGEQVTLDHVGIFADGVAVKRVGDLTFRMCQQYVDKIITVNNDEISAAMETFFDETRGILEPAGALALAGIVQTAERGKLGPLDQSIAICSGANISFSSLRFVAERSEIGRHREGLFMVHLPERPGSLLDLCNKVVNGHNITEICYRKGDDKDARLLLGVELENKNDRQAFTRRLEVHGYGYSDVSDDPLAEHGRRLVGGANGSYQNGSEQFYQLEFPERPGALTEFLSQVSGTLNVSLFQYRNGGGDRGRVLIGFEVDGKNDLEGVLSAFTTWHEPVPPERIKLYGR